MTESRSNFHMFLIFCCANMSLLGTVAKYLQWMIMISLLSLLLPPIIILIIFIFIITILLIMLLLLFTSFSSLSWSLGVVKCSLSQVLCSACASTPADPHNTDSGETEHLQMGTAGFGHGHQASPSSCHMAALLFFLPWPIFSWLAVSTPFVGVLCGCYNQAFRIWLLTL